MPGYQEIIWTMNAVLLGWILNQYFKLRKEISLMQLSLVKNYATNEALEKLISNQDKMLNALTEMRVDQATIFERIERFHNEAKETALQAQSKKQRKA